MPKLSLPKVRKRALLCFIGMFALAYFLEYHLGTIHALRQLEVFFQEERLLDWGFPLYRIGNSSSLSAATWGIE